MNRKLPRSEIRLVLWCWSLYFAVGANAYATSQCFQWQASVVTNYPPGRDGIKRVSDWLDSIDAAKSAIVAFCNQYGSCHTYCPTTLPGNCVSYGPVNVTLAWPQVLATTLSVTFANGSTGASGVAIIDRSNPDVCKVYVSAPPPPLAECGPSCNGVGDPINPASGAVYDTIVDVPETASSSGFKRFYNSTVSGSANPSSGWRHSFSRNIKAKYAGTDYRLYVPSADNSSLYNDEATACTSGFAQIKGRVSTWASATANYANGVCWLSVGASGIGTLPLYYTSRPTPNPSAMTLIGFDATRDDGELIRFIGGGSSIVAPPGTKLKLQQTGSGYVITDTEDRAEIYNANGRLLSITSRTGIVQTMGYDSVGRLSTVTDSFGHQITLSYDTQGRLSTVTHP